MNRCIVVLLVLSLLVEVEGWFLARRRSCSKQNCRLGQWTSWTSCSDSCGIFGSQSRSRLKLTTESCGGICWSTYETRHCNTKCCPVDCVYKYGDWGQCKGTCGTGTQESHRIIVTAEKCGGRCTAPAVKTRACDTKK